jgi:tetratricopeptide (TPR) repeat protein
VRLYEQTQYPEAEALFRTTLDIAKDCTDRQRVSLHYHLGKVHLAQDNNLQAVKEMREALRLDPYWSVDPMSASPKVLMAIHQARLEMAADVANAAKPAPAPSTPAKPSAKRTAGYALLGLGSALAATAGASGAWLYSEDVKQHQAADKKDWPSRDRHYENTRIAMYSAAGLGASSAISLAVAAYCLASNDAPAMQTKHARYMLMPELSAERPGVALAIEF